MTARRRSDGRWLAAIAVVVEFVCGVVMTAFGLAWWLS